MFKMKQKVVYLQNLVQQIWKMSVNFQFHETNRVELMFCIAAMFFHHKPFETFH